MHGRAHGDTSRTGPEPPRAAVIVNPTKVEDERLLRRHVTRLMGRYGWAEPMWLPTTIEDTGRNLAQRAVKDGAALVLSCGGDGTVMACVSGVAGTGVPMAVLPAGTGNLLVRNLGLPSVVEDAVHVALTGDDRALDVGRVEYGVTGADEEWRFAVMAGVGFDAAIMEDAPEALKRRVGWPAYLVSGARHLWDRPMTVGVRVDDGPRLTLRAQTVLIGNVGRLQGGIDLLPDAEPDDGVLDVVAITPRNVLEWARVGLNVIIRRVDQDGQVQHWRGRRIEIRTLQPQPMQLDGDPLGETMRLVVQVEPGALLLRVPPAGR